MSSKIAWNTRESLSQKVSNVNIGDTVEVEEASILPSAARKNSVLEACPVRLLIRAHCSNSDARDYKKAGIPLKTRFTKLHCSG